MPHHRMVACLGAAVSAALISSLLFFALGTGGGTAPKARANNTARQRSADGTNPPDLHVKTVDYAALFHSAEPQAAVEQLKRALYNDGIVAILNVPTFDAKSQAYFDAFRNFSALPLSTKLAYEPNRAIDDYLGFELGKEKFRDLTGKWVKEDKKASFYAWVPHDPTNKWPREVDIRTSITALSQLILDTGKQVLHAVSLDNNGVIDFAKVRAFSRGLHYLKEADVRSDNPNWCGAHYDHGLFTGLVGERYYRDGQRVDAPAEAGLHVRQPHTREFRRVRAPKDAMLFQVGEFGQLVANDRIRATEHLVRKSFDDVERFTLAVFFSADPMTSIKSTSVLAEDSRYADHAASDGSCLYKDWNKASFDRYLVEDPAKKKKEL